MVRLVSEHIQCFVVEFFGMQVYEFPVAIIHGCSLGRSKTLPQESLDCLGPTLAL